MRKHVLTYLGLFMISFFAKGMNVVDWVNPLMGTESTFSFSKGNTYPAVAVPWGMNFWSPQTGENGSGWMYAYTDRCIRGFRQTHQPSPWINDYGTFSFMPLSGDLIISDKQRGVSFSHDREVSKPYLYEVTFDNGTKTSITASSRGAIAEIEYPEVDSQYLVLDAFEGGSKVFIDRNKKQICGYTKYNHGGVPRNFANYFVVAYDQEPIGWGTSTNDHLQPNSIKAEHHHVTAYLQFNLAKGEKLSLRMASSFISLEQAQRNLQQEVETESFQSLCAKNKETWNREMGKIEVEDNREENCQTFYSCLYRVLLFPRAFYEYDENHQPIYYSPYDGKIKKGHLFTDNGFWDTFRAVHPLFTLLYPEVSEKVMESLLHAYEESGFLPEWCSPGHRGCMIGNNSISLMTDAWMKGIRGFDPHKALEAMIHQTRAEGAERSVGRDGAFWYDLLGYVPYPEVNEATAKTLEYAYADWCLARFAENIGEKQIAQDYYQSAQNYRHLFDSQWGFMRAKNKEGAWIEPFNPVEWGGPFTEGSSWHYTWSVMHDVKGLSQLMGGNEKMSVRLDSMFTAPATFDYGSYGFEIHEITEMVALNMGQYAHGNQPVQHAIYLYDYVGQPWKTQYHVRDVLTKLYQPTPGGYCGDEDNGQTSAWYVFSALGFYPVCPGTAEYAMGAPLFKKTTLHLPSGKTLIINSPKNDATHFYVNKVTLNKKDYDLNYFKHETLEQGGVLNFEMSNKPNLKRGTAEKSFPYSYTK